MRRLQTSSTDLAEAVRTYASRTSVPYQSGTITTHLREIEDEAIEIMREVAATCRKPVFLFSAGKDSMAMLHVARKAFHPGRMPFPFLHIATGWDFQDLLRFRDLMTAALGLELIVHTNESGLQRGINPIASPAALHAQVMSTESLKQALDAHGFDAAFGGARRDEEKSRAKERIFSFRTPQHHWDPRSQRPELWALYNTRLRADESIRVFPLSNWTERDVWDYLRAEEVPIVPLYFAAERPTVQRHGTLIMQDDERLPLAPGEHAVAATIRFRTLGCYPLTGAVPSQARDIDEIIAELASSSVSERSGRVIDLDDAASMEHKKREGYF
jgi:sulfate adenylyltransferase subunit 2